MRPVRILAGAATISVVAMLGGVVSATAASGTNYVALGDSYSSGVGTDVYFHDGTSCDRSSEGYPELWAAAHSITWFTLAACSGATAADVLNGQLGGLSASTNLVTITVGGNDAGSSSVFKDCAFDSDSACVNEVNNAESFVRTTLVSRLDNLYRTVRSHAPNASVVVLDYPRFYQIPGSCLVGLSNTKRAAINGGVDVLDDTIQAEVAKFANFHFGDVRSVFAPHEICSTGTSWLHSVDFVNLTDSYHPTPAGYSNGYLPVLDGVTG